MQIRDTYIVILYLMHYVDPDQIATWLVTVVKGNTACSTAWWFLGKKQRIRQCLSNGLGTW